MPKTKQKLGAWIGGSLAILAAVAGLIDHGKTVVTAVEGVWAWATHSRSQPRADPRRAAREIADQVLDQISSVLIPLDHAHYLAHADAVNTLKELGGLDFAFQHGAFGPNNKWGALSESQKRDNRTRRVQVLASFRTQAATVVSDWQHIVDAVSLTEANMDNLPKLDPSLTGYANNLKLNLPGWTTMRDDLLLAIAMAKGEEDGTRNRNWSPTSMAAEVGMRLSKGLKDPLDRLRSSWQEIKEAAK